VAEAREIFPIKTVEGYFDFVSPFSYLQMFRFGELPDDVEIAFYPVLFAELLGRWGHKGPAEIPAKRIFTMRHVAWLAGHDAIPCKLPLAFPFNPIRALRLCLALGSRRDTVETIFRCVWQDVLLPDKDAGWCAIADAEVKASLISNGGRAQELGIYGAPTFDAGGELFWGADATDFLLDFLCSPGLPKQEEFSCFAAAPSSAPMRSA